ncbi:AlkA N-terminal domain-containing protein [Marichromatium sp. PS1]|uniref:DNA-3-methyladenine glycosylase 2 family protein n=1 Tax=Marichromatium sp. PS1 TaxID=3138932 RepID=UPI0032E72FD6
MTSTIAPDDLALYRSARLRRDADFDGRFYFGVRTTGVFCRPSCPAPRAREENVAYFATLFEAVEQGFRPCLRCRPDMRSWTRHAHVEGGQLVAMALDLIQRGYLHHHGVDDLAAELLLSARQLRALFVRFLGVPPVKVGALQKAVLAKGLLLDSTFPITDIAFASGFGSVRQFNEVFRKVFGQTPGALREMRRHQGLEDGCLSYALDYDPGFDFGRVLDFLRRRAIRGVEVVTATQYARTFRVALLGRAEVAEGYFVVTDDPARSALALRIHSAHIACAMEIAARVRRMFDLETRFAEIQARFAADDLLRPGLEDGAVPRLSVAFDPFEFAVRAILGQQVSVRFAGELAARLAACAAQPTPADYPEGLDWFFPDRARLAGLDLSTIGLARARQAAVHALCRALEAGVFSLSPHQPADSFKRDILSVKGIGEWTADYVAMRGLGLVDSFPVTDLGIVKALTRERPMTRAEALRHAERWRPYRAYAALCLWNTNAVRAAPAEP